MQTDEASKPTILIVDDSESQRSLLRLYCRKLGYACLLAEDGATALDVVNEHEVGIFLLDLGLPDMDGRELVKLIRKQERSVESRFYASTGAPRESKTEIMAAGFDAVLFKPFTRERLRQLLATKAVTPVVSVIESTAYEALQNMGPDILANLVATFESEALERIAQLRTAAESNDVETLRKEAHALKGAALVLAAMALSDLCRDLELKAASGIIEDPVSIVSKIGSVLAETLRQLRQT